LKVKLDHHSPAHQESSEPLFATGVVVVKFLNGRMGAGTRLDIEKTAVKHVALAQLQRWANEAAKSPAERIRRERMRMLLEGTST
jgi:hypothetical protein